MTYIVIVVCPEDSGESVVHTLFSTAITMVQPTHRMWIHSHVDLQSRHPEIHRRPPQGER